MFLSAKFRGTESTADFHFLGNAPRLHWPWPCQEILRIYVFARSFVHFRTLGLNSNFRISLGFLFGTKCGYMFSSIMSAIIRPITSWKSWGLPEYPWCKNTGQFRYSLCKTYGGPSDSQALPDKELLATGHWKSWMWLWMWLYTWVACLGMTVAVHCHVLIVSSTSSRLGTVMLH